MSDGNRRASAVDAPTHTTRRVRWGMLVVAIVIDVALVGSGLMTFFANREAAADVADARALDLFRGVKHAMREWRDAHAIEPGALLDDRGPLRQAVNAALGEVVADLQDRGLRYVGIAIRRGEILVSAGEARTGPIVEPREPAPPGPPGELREPEPGRPGPPGEPLTERIGDRVRVVGPLGPPGMGPRRGPLLVLEIDPEIGDRLADRALTQLAVSVTAAAVLAVAALVLWRMGRKADRIEAQLARDRRLAALGEMSAVLGHELRNPLAALKGHAQLVVERLEPEARARKSAERVVHEATRMELLMRRVLDFVRTGTVELRPTDPSAVARAAAEHLPRDEHAPRDLVRLELEQAPPSWDLDRERLEQVLENLLENALQAGPDGPIELSCRLDGDHLVYTVRDHGPGFPDGELDAVFEPFRTHRVQGTGLGLAIARRIVEAHRGRIAAENAPGGGALVRVTLPRADARTLTR